ncbi:PilN domain-containing protein [Xanthomonadaceae bacterium JHOS43]|nr:PilN domain-containing protein [Xanthomonadaceae bacterium JHOS43]
MPTISDQLAQSLSRLTARYAQSPIPAFLAWWGGELRACLPLRWRRRFRVSERSILLRLEGDELIALAQREGASEELGRLPATPPESLPAALNELLDEDSREARRVLLIPSRAVLRRTLQLPVAALENLSSVLGFELDRQTPFRADQVYYDSRVLPHEPDARQTSVQLALITRQRLAEELAGIDGLASTLSAVDADEAGGGRAGFNFLPPEQRARRNHTFGWLMAGLAVATLFFLWLGMNRIIDNRAEAIVRLQAEVDAQRDEARAVTRLRDELDTAAAGANFLAVEKFRQPSMLLLLEDLTRLLPDDTFLERLSVTRGELTLAGQSSQAPKLVELLQDSKTFRSPSLSGPIQPDSRSGKDRFNIAAQFGAQSEDGDAPDAGR